MSLINANNTVARCTLTRQYDYTLEWIPEKNYAAGTQIELRGGCLRSFHSWRYVAMRMETGDITFRWRHDTTPTERWQNKDRVIMRANLQYGVRQGRRYPIRITAIPPIWAGIDETVSVWTINVPNNFRPDDPLPDAEKETGSQCTLPVVANAVNRMSVYSRPMAGPEDEVRTCIVPEDRYGNPTQFKNKVQARLRWQGDDWTEQIAAPMVMSLPEPEDIGRLTVSIPMAALTGDETIRNGTRRNGRLEVVGNPVWSRRMNNLRPAFGEIHWHTNVSGDGQRPIEEALFSARRYLNMDFAAPGDHNPQGEDWQRTVRGLQEYDEPGIFATFFGWENGTDQGHENYYFTEPDHPLVCGGKAGITGGHPDELIDELNKYDEFIAVPHHTNAEAETKNPETHAPFWHPYPFGEPQDYIQLIEIIQGRGNQERNVYDDEWRGWHRNNASVQDALANGYRVGFTGGTDNHCGWPARAFSMHEGGGIHSPKSVILTGVWTQDVERETIFDGLESRHTWAVWDTRAIVWFAVNGGMAGDEISVPEGEQLTAHLTMSAEDALQSVEIVSEREAVWSSSFDDRDIDLKIELGAANSGTHYYLRALQRDGGIIYASPVFVHVE